MAHARPLRILLTAILAAGMAGPSIPIPAARAATTPEIRTSAAHKVPACVTPERLMHYLATRNTRLELRFRDIASHYKRHGDALRIRWDYAFFQMLLETNFLTYRRGDGRPGDVQPRQNNFAGLGATGGGVAGDSFPDVPTGVLAQMQHLLAYSGERVDRPVAPRTRDKQDDIVAASLTLRRPVRFADLTKRWAADRNYANSIEVIADGFRRTYCADAVQQAGAGHIALSATAETDPARQAQVLPAETCGIWEASYGGPVAVLIRHVQDASVSFTVLEVQAGFEQPQSSAFMKAHARGGQMIGRFASRNDALARALELCPGPS